MRFWTLKPVELIVISELPNLVVYAPHEIVIHLFSWLINVAVHRATERGHNFPRNINLVGLLMLSGETPVLPGVPRPSRYDSNLFMVWSKRDELKPKLRVGSSAGNDCMKKSFYNEVYFDFFFFFFWKWLERLCIWFAWFVDFETSKPVWPVAKLSDCLFLT